jgi:hypothetical protein
MTTPKPIIPVGTAFLACITEWRTYVHGGDNIVHELVMLDDSNVNYIDNPLNYGPRA